jgi:hypothetical protein
MVQEERNLGYTIEVKWPEDIQIGSTKKICWRQAVLAYADDTTWLARSKEDLTNIIALANEFYDINDIKINGKKSELVVLNSKEKQIEIEIGENNDKIVAKRGNQAVRFLGVWITEKNAQQNTIKIIKKEVNSLVQAMKKKKTTLAQLIYINNRVLIPRAEYRAQMVILNRKTCEKLHRPFLKLIKMKSNLALTTSNSILNHRNIVGVQLM